MEKKNLLAKIKGQKEAFRAPAPKMERKSMIYHITCSNSLDQVELRRHEEQRVLSQSLGKQNKQEELLHYGLSTYHQVIFKL